MSRPFAAEPLEYSFDISASGVARHGPYHPNSQLDRQREELTYGSGFYINDAPIGSAFGRHLDPVYSDWIDLALAVYYADRLSPRRDPKDPARPYQWSRRISLSIPVRLPDLWTSPAVLDQVERALRFFTEDAWDLKFVPSVSNSRSQEVQAFLFSTPVSMPAYVALLSGGLDSFAGACRAVAEETDYSFVFISGVTNSRQRAAQREQVRALRRLARHEVYHITVPFGLSRYGRLRGEGEEQTQRSRGFLFLTLGAVTSLMAGSNALHVHENGIGAINLPYDATQIGTSSSRGVHPLSLLMMQKLVEALVGKSFRFHNPHLYQTKGEMCKHPAVRRLAPFVWTTFSCDGFPVQVHGKPQCGSCTSCLLRRLSLQVADLCEFDTGEQYLCDLLDRTSKPSEKQLRQLNAMEWQFRKIAQRIRGQRAWENLVLEFPDLQTIATELGARAAGGRPEVCGCLIELYSKYVSEWEHFSARRQLGAFARAA